jgi:hypothetical protein
MSLFLMTLSGLRIAAVPVAVLDTAGAAEAAAGTSSARTARKQRRDGKDMPAQIFG